MTHGDFIQSGDMLCTQGKYGKSLGCKGVIAKNKKITQVKQNSSTLQG
jgi:hypothetical protein